MIINSILGPVEEPISLAELKIHLRLGVDSSEEDSYLRNLISASRRLLERYTFRSFLTQTWKLVLDKFPKQDSDCIYLPYPPIQSVKSFVYLDSNRIEVALEENVFFKVDTISEPGRIYLMENQSWPSDVLDEPSAISITYVAGWASKENLPTELKQAMLLLCGDLFLIRESVSYGEKNPDLISSPIAGLCEPYRVFEFV